MAEHAWGDHVKWRSDLLIVTDYLYGLDRFIGSDKRSNSVSWKAPFRQSRPEATEDVRQRFGPLPPSVSLREVAMMTGLFVLLMSAVVAAIELYV